VSEDISLNGRLFVSGNVGIGIGTTNPAYKLDIVSEANKAPLNVKIGTTDVLTVNGSGVVGFAGGANFNGGTVNFSGATVTNIPQSAITSLTTNLAAKAPLASPSFTGSVGIGTTNPQATLDVLSNASLTYETCRFTNTNDLKTQLKIYQNLNDTNYNAMVSTGDIGIIWGSDPTTPAPASGLVIGPWSTGYNGLKIKSSGYVGIGKSDPTYTLDVNGSFRCKGIVGYNPNNGSSGNIMYYYWSGTQFVFNVDGAANSYYYVSPNSDYRIKHNFREPQDILKRLCKIKLFDYQFKDIGIIKNDGHYRLGLFAHELQEMFPDYGNLVQGEKDGVNNEGEIIIQSITGETIQYFLLKAIQEQQTIIETQQNEIQELKNEIQTILERLTAANIL
jgi:hypothetical protein